jgi:hypothetical protein
MQLVKAASRLGLAFAAVLATVVLTGCERIYDLTIENHLRQEVRVSTGWLGYKIRPCSVRIDRGVTGGRLIPVEVKDAEGNLIYLTKEEPQANATGVQELLVRIPSEGAGECPEPVTGTFMLTVKNHTRKEVIVQLGGREVGRVPPTAIETLGPFLGTWMTARTTLSIRDPLGTSLGTVMKADYDLGQIPEFVVAARP